MKPAGALSLALTSLYVSVAAQYFDNDRVPDPLPRDQFFEYVTRPDLLPPRWNITMYDRDALSRDGYWFTAIYETLLAKHTNKPYIGASIYDEDGELIWSPGLRFHGADANDFRMTHIGGQQRLTFISLEDQNAVVLNQAYEEIKRYPIARPPEKANMHEFNIVDDGKSAMILFHNFTNASIEQSQSVNFENGHCKIKSHYLEETNLTDWENWTTAFKWQMLDHIKLNESNFERGDIDKHCTKKWDFLHANAVDKCSDGNLILSTRNTDTIFKINRTDGSIIWRLGGYTSDFEMDFVFSKQHHARCRSFNSTHTILSFLDNANGELNVATHPFSRGLLVSLDHAEKRASILAEYNHPDEKIQGARGNAEILDNGNMFMGWSERSLISEHTPDGRMIMSARTVPDWLVTYRSYKFPWVGKPKSLPDVVSRVSSNKTLTTEIYVSWNGATEVKKWNVYRTDPSGKMAELITSSSRQGFETRILHEGFVSNVVVEAIDKLGVTLGRSRVINTDLPEEEQHTPPHLDQAKIEDEQWIEDALYQQQHPYTSRAGLLSIGAAILLFIAGAISGIVLGSRFRSRGRGRMAPWMRTASFMPLRQRDDKYDEATGGLDYDEEYDDSSRREAGHKLRVFRQL